MSIASALSSARPTPLELPAHAAAAASSEAVTEERRWLLMLVPPFLVSATFFAAAVGTGWLWLMGPTLVLGPGLIILGFVYLGLSSDTNGAGGTR